MGDQVEGLRQLIRERRESSVSDSKGTRLVAVASGKGGVGKSNIVLNLALSLQELGERVAVLDADLGFANLDILLGVRPKYTLQDVLDGTVPLLNAFTVVSGGLSLISGGSGVLLDEHGSRSQLAHFAEEMTTLNRRYDRVYIDFGAGLSRYTAEMIALCDDVLLVLTPEPTALADAYALLKMIAQNGALPRLHLVINRAHSVGQAGEAARKLTLVVGNFLHAACETLGYVLEDEAVMRAVNRQIPFVTGEPKSIAAKCVRQLAKNTVAAGLERQDPPRGLRALWDRFTSKW